MRIRPDRVANAIKREIGKILHEDLKDPRVAFTTITGVDVTPDLRNAKVHYSVLGTEKEKKARLLARLEAARVKESKEKSELEAARKAAQVEKEKNVAAAELQAIKAKINKTRHDIAGVVAI